VLWVQKMTDSGDMPKDTSLLVQDKDVGSMTRLELEGSVTPEEARRLVETGGWVYVERPSQLDEDDSSPGA
jgi:hypothetical protein